MTEVRAAGGVVTRADGRVAVVHRPKYDDWSLPKGKLDPGESWEQAALREVEEETGLRCRLGEELEPDRYVDSRGRPKLVRWWRMEVVEDLPFSPSDEVDALEWWTAAEAAERLSYAHDRSLVAAPAERVRLRDGAEVLIRPVRADDRALLAEGFDRLSPESRFTRFLGFKKRLTDRELTELTDVDHRRHEAIAALDPRTGEGVAVARFVRPEPDDEAAEAAVAVVDDWQGRGLGGVLLGRLAEQAAAVGVRRFTAALLTSNRAMLELFDRLGAMTVRSADADVLTIDVELPVQGADGLRDALRAARRDVTAS